MDMECFQPVLVGITRQGGWYYYAGEVSRIEKDTWYDADCFSACLSPDRIRHELIVFRENEIRRISIDVVFPVLHGQNGEDGTVQGLCEPADIPLVEDAAQALLSSHARPGCSSPLSQSVLRGRGRGASG